MQPIIIISSLSISSSLSSSSSSSSSSTTTTATTSSSASLLHQTWRLPPIINLFEADKPGITIWIITIHTRRTNRFPLGNAPWNVFRDSISHYLSKCFSLSGRRSCSTFQSDSGLKQRLSNVKNSSVEKVIELLNLFNGQHLLKVVQMPFSVLNSHIAVNCFQTMRG